MANLVRILKQLQRERSLEKKDLDRLDRVIAAFAKLVGTNPRRAMRGAPRARRRLSVATRRKMAKAQKARWAKVRQQKMAAN